MTTTQENSVFKGSGVDRPTNPHTHALILLFFLPFTEMGLTFHLSVSSLGILYMVFVSVRYYSSGWLSIHRATALVALISLLTVAIFYSYPYDMEPRNTARILFQLMLICSMTYIINKSACAQGFTEPPPAKPLRRTLLTLLGLIASIGLIQTLDIHFNQSLSTAVPTNFFAADRSYFIQDARRPPITYSEPSYCAAICTSIAFINATTVRSKAVMALSLICIAIIQSFAGFITVLLLSTPVLLGTSLRDRTFASLAAVGSIALIALVSSDNELGIANRITNIESDASGIVRLANPPIATMHVFSNDPLGVQQAFMGNYAQNNNLPMMWGSYIINGNLFKISRPAFVDNGFFNILLHHGVLGLIIVPLFIYIIRATLFFHLAFILIMMSFNGDYFSPDKVFMMTLSLWITILYAKHPHTGNSINQSQHLIPLSGFTKKTNL